MTIWKLIKVSIKLMGVYYFGRVSRAEWSTECCDCFRLIFGRQKTPDETDHEPSVSTRTPLGLHAARTNIHAGRRRHPHNSTYTWTRCLGKHVEITGQYSSPLWSPRRSNTPSSHGGQRCKEEGKVRQEKDVKNCEEEREWQWIYINIMFHVLCKANAELSSQTQKIPVFLLGAQKLQDPETANWPTGPARKGDRYRGCQE